PRNLDADSIRDEKVKVFSSIKPLDGDWMENVVFGQYGKGIVEGKKVLAYNEEENIPKNSRTETFVAMKLALENWRWSGVPFYLRTGKRLEKQGTTVVVEFKKVPSILYNKSANLESNKLIIKIQPDEEISMEFNVKSGTQVKSIETKFDQKSYFKMKSPEAYENILLNIAMSDQTLFTRFDGVEKSWEIVDKLADCHENCPIIYKYESGSWGPEMADKLLEKDGRKWWN
ncbi:MAG: glucose-6-phosphate dehydrogenase, partial [Nanoarchaeota archaeon]